MDMLFATNNAHKVREIQSLLPDDLRILTLVEAGLQEEIPEPFETLERNAQAKIQYALQRTGIQAGFSEDSGLFVTALEGRPGVHSAHYAGNHRNDADNIERVLQEMVGATDRKAYFQTIICLVWAGQEKFFSGVCEGTLLTAPQGNGGFGYDPIFQPDGADKTFAELSLTDKNRFSHRKKAVQQLIDFLRQGQKSS
ncbi:MAG: RdgB/HAM1 family non-canonical purine NTP pyrophosphatase [Bacteroidetes bacterium]|nr:RdgB/HAM1 family non-canonical purine NTP pyrophosphatase [Bacteroidota bacterium]